MILPKFSPPLLPAQTQLLPSSYLILHLTFENSRSFKISSLVFHFFFALQIWALSQGCQTRVSLSISNHFPQISFCTEFIWVGSLGRVHFQLQNYELDARGHFRQWEYWRTLWFSRTTTARKAGRQKEEEYEKRDFQTKTKKQNSPYSKSQKIWNESFALKRPVGLPAII